MQCNENLALFWYFGQLGLVWGRPKIEFHQKLTPNSESALKMYKIGIDGFFTTNLTSFATQCNIKGFWHIYWYFGQLGVVGGGQKLSFIKNELQIRNQHQKNV